MRSGILSASLAVVASVNALPQELSSGKPLAPPLPISSFKHTGFPEPIPLEEAKVIFKNYTSLPSGAVSDLYHYKTVHELKKVVTELTEGATINITDELNEKVKEATDKIHEITDKIQETTGKLKARATCANVRVRMEWDSFSDSGKQQFVDAVKCLMGRAPSGQFAQSRSRYEDLVALHQTLTPNVHLNSKFLLWHRYLLWTFESLLRDECGYQQSVPWFDETRYAGRFAQSSIFSDRWLGGLALGGDCVRNGQFANTNINVGPGTSNQPHCLARNGDGSLTAYCNADYVNQCNAYTDFAGMAFCTERGPHSYGHNGIGSVMQDVYASPGDPVFWLHHGFIDRNFRIWTNADPSRLNTINGNDISGRPLSLDDRINVYGIRPDVRIRDVMDTTQETLCYRYNY